jgi:hypothetical protein
MNDAPDRSLPLAPSPAEETLPATWEPVRPGVVL